MGADRDQGSLDQGAMHVGHGQPVGPVAAGQAFNGDSKLEAVGAVHRAEDKAT